MIVNKYLLFALVCSLGYPSLFSIFFDFTLSMIVCSLVHAGCSATILYRVISKSLLKEKFNVGMPIMFIIVNLLYFNASSIKYFEKELTEGFIDDNGIRLLFSLLSLLVLWISFEIVIVLKSKCHVHKFELRNEYLLKIIIVSVLLFIGINLIEFFQKGFGYNYHQNMNPLEVAMDNTYLPILEKIRMWVLSSVNVTLVLLLALYFGERRRILLITTAVMLILLVSFFTGGRSAIFFFFLGLAFSLVRLYGFGRRTLAKVFLALPLIICIMSICILSFSGRINANNLEQVRFQLAYRFDLTDYAATIIGKSNLFNFNYQVIVDAIYYSIPKIVCPDKYKSNKNTVLRIRADAGLNESTDYTDTFFSIGVQVGGVIGFVFVPFLMVLFLYFFECFICLGFGQAAKFIIIAMYPLYLSVETDFNSLLADWRMVPVYIVVGVFISYLFVKRPLLNFRLCSR